MAISVEIGRWKARNEAVPLRGVREWDPQTGALTSAELELLRQFLEEPKEGEDPKTHAIHILARILLETLKRTSQVLGIKANGLRRFRSKSNQTEWFLLLIPKVKGQTGQLPEWWRISERLALDIMAFERPEIRELQAKYNRLIVWETSSLKEYGEINSALAKGEIMALVRNASLISPRTGQPLHVTPLRLRHTGATRLAGAGVPRDVISYLLEHEAPETAKAYIDAIGSDLVPAIERSDRALGGLFEGLNEIFFKGRITPKLEGGAIYIPIVSASPAVVGACARDTMKEGKCAKHSFYACYDGCPSFLAWREADHCKALAFVKGEMERWSKAEGHRDRWKALAEYERLHRAIGEVIARIEQERMP